MVRGFGVDVSILSGVPVIDVTGVWIPALARKLQKTLQTLARAGHYELVIQLQRAAIEGANSLQSLVPMAQMLRAKHGHLYVVATTEQLVTLSQQADNGQIRFSSSETAAIRWIKRIPFAEEVCGVRAQLRAADTATEPN